MENGEVIKAMDQFDHAVRLLSSPETGSEVHAQAIAYVDQVKHSETGWLGCAQRFLSGPFSCAETKFHCLVVVEHAIKTRMAAMEATEKTAMRQFLEQWLANLGIGQPEAPYIRNKVILHAHDVNPIPACI